LKKGGCEVRVGDEIEGVFGVEETVLDAFVEDGVEGGEVAGGGEVGGEGVVGGGGGGGVRDGWRGKG